MEDPIYNKYCKNIKMLDKLNEKYKDDVITFFKRPIKPIKIIKDTIMTTKEYKRQYYLENKEKYKERNKLYRLNKKKDNI